MIEYGLFFYLVDVFQKIALNLPWGHVMENWQLTCSSPKMTQFKICSNTKIVKMRELTFKKKIRKLSALFAYSINQIDNVKISCHPFSTYFCYYTIHVKTKIKCGQIQSEQV